MIQNNDYHNIPQDLLHSFHTRVTVNPRTDFLGPRGPQKTLIVAPTVIIGTDNKNINR